MSPFDPEAEPEIVMLSRSPSIGTVTAEYIAADLRALAVPIDSLRPMPGNARTHGERDLSAIADSLRAHGQQRPIVVARRYRSTENAIIAGCGTWAAAKRLGWRFIAASWFTAATKRRRPTACATTGRAS